jgi:endonuclease G
VRVFSGGADGAQRAVADAIRIASDAAADSPAIDLETTNDGATFVTVDVGREIGTVSPSNARSDAAEQRVTCVTMLVRNDRIVSAYPSAVSRGMEARAGRAMTEQALRTSAPARIADGAVTRYLTNDPAPYRARNFEPRGHAVFDGGERRANSVVTEAWRRATAEMARPGSDPGVTIDLGDRGDASFVTVDMGQRIGYIGGRLGGLNGNPAADRVQLVVVAGEIKYAYPVSRGFQPLAFQGGPRIGPSGSVTLPPLAREGRAVEHPREALSYTDVAHRLGDRLASGEDNTPRGQARAAMARAMALRGAPRPERTAGERGARAGAAARTVQRGDAGIARHVRLGMPTPAGRTDRSDYLVAYNGWVASLRNGAGTNWVAWSMDASDMGEVERAEDFRPDPTLPRDWQGNSDESFGEGGRFGLHRGHARPSGETSANPRMNSGTFLYSNVFPQAENSNTGAWNGLEQYSRLMARQGFTLHVVAGALYLGQPRFVGPGVQMPSHLYKVIVATPNGTRPEQIDARTRVISILLPNDNYALSRTDRWTDFRVSPATIERLTARSENGGGAVRFFDHLPRDVADALRAQTDAHDVPDEITAMRSFLPNRVETSFESITYRAPSQAAAAASR